MSKNNNVNPGQYKVAGRERPGEDVLASAHKAALTQARAKQDQQPVPPRESRSAIAIDFYLSSKRPEATS